MADKIQIRRDTIENWRTFNPILSEGEMVFIITQDTNPARINAYTIGDGVNKFNDLPLYSMTPYQPN